MQSWISSKAEKGKHSLINGRGLFAIMDISKDEIVAVKAGRILTGEQVQALPFNQNHAHYEQQIGDNLFVCPASDNEKYDSMIFINHSCTPNVGLRGDVVYVAMQDIKAGAELTVDYAMMDNRNYRIPCNCGSKNCRGTISGYDFKRPENLRYGKYLSAYIQTKLGLV